MEGMEFQVPNDILRKMDFYKKKIRSRALSMDYDFISCEFNYVCSMDNLEKMLEKYGEIIEAMTVKYAVSKDICMKFRKECAGILMEAAMKRGEFRLGIHVAKKYGISLPETDGI